MATTGRENDNGGAPPGIPWLQALGLLTVCFIIWIDSGVPDFDPPDLAYVAAVFAIIGASPRDVLAMAEIFWKRSR